MYEYDYEQELKEKQNEIDRQEIQLAECQRDLALTQCLSGI